MPPVRTLNNPAPAKHAPKGDVEPSHSETAVATAPKAGAIALPAWAKTDPPALPQMNNGPAAVYVGQLQPNTGKRASLLQQGVKEGDYYLDNMGQVTPLPNFRFWLLDAAAYKTEMNAAGEIVTATRDMDRRAKGLEEHAVALILVDTPHGIVPAKCDFRKAQSPAYAEAARGIEGALSPDFPKTSDATRVAASFPVPWGRVVTQVNVEKRVSKSSGKPYFLSSGVCTPSTVTDMQKLAAFLNDNASGSLVDAATESFKHRVGQIAKKCQD